MTYVEPMALFLSLYRYVNGPGATVTFFGTEKNFRHTYTASSQDIIARSEIFLSIEKPDEAHGEAFNTADTATPGPWSYKWPKICEYFGLQGGGPGNKPWNDADKFWNDHQEDYERMCKEYGLQKRDIPEATWIFMRAGFTMLERNREMSLDKIRSLGFKEEYPVGHGYFRVFDHLVSENIVPPKEKLQ